MRPDHSKNRTQATVQPVGSPNVQVSVACSISLQAEQTVAPTPFLPLLGTSLQLDTWGTMHFIRMGKPTFTDPIAQEYYRQGETELETTQSADAVLRKAEAFGQ